MAENVWWNSAQGPPSGSFYPVTSVDAVPYLTVAPCPICRGGFSDGVASAEVEAARDPAVLNRGGVGESEAAAWLRQEIRRTRQALALAPEAPEAPGHVLALAHLQRLDRENALGEYDATWALLRSLRASLTTTTTHQPASSAAFRVEVQEAVRTGDYDGARSLLDSLGTAVTNEDDLLALDLAQVALYEEASDYASALARLEAVQAGLDEEHGLLAEALFHTAAALEQRFAEGTYVSVPGAQHASSPALLDLPAVYSLEAAYPNPFTGRTTVSFALPEAARVTVEAYDLLGRRVATLVDRSFEPGRHEVTLDGRSLASGVYVVRAVMEAEGDNATQVFTQRVTLMR
jgi:hypothetical protein